MERRDIIRLKKIVDYCEDITGVLESFGDEQNVFFCNLMFQKVIAFDIFQIGELVATLTEEFKRNNPQIPWAEIKGLRNIIVHHYGSVNHEELWRIANVDVPQLRDYCNMTIQTANLEM